MDKSTITREAIEQVQKAIDSWMPMPHTMVVTETTMMAIKDYLDPIGGACDRILRSRRNRIRLVFHVE